jgi:choice-of-anchor B domain-containing protein
MIAAGGLAAGCFGAEEYEWVPGFTGAPAPPGAGPGSGGSAAQPGPDGQNPPQGSAGVNAGPGPGAGGTGSPSVGGSGNTSGGGPGNAGSAGDGPVKPGPTFMCEDVDVDCVNGKAGEFDCQGVDLLAHLDGPSMQGGTGNDIWGWTDPTTLKEYAIVGMTNGTAFVDISDPCRPVHLGHLRTETVNAIWRDIKVYRDHAYIVSESQAHGMQVFDLTQLRNVANPPVTFEANRVVNSFGSAHNIVLNEESGFAYTVLNNNCPLARSFDLSDPTNPVDVGCWGSGGRTHDAHCVNYKGPDPAYAGREICVNANEGAGIFVFDVTDKSNVTLVGSLRYDNVSYSHQGWFTEDHRYFLAGDEADELQVGINTTIYILDMTNLAAPTVLGTWVNDLPTTDHNIYIRGNHAFLACYAAGVRILDLTNIAQGELTEVGYFDTFPRHNNPGFTEMWSNYPFFKSGVLVTNGSEGLFVLHPNAEFMQ